jgi:predicted glutamine amidotransferase
MCRMFGLHAGRSEMKATFWLIDAPDSLAAQSKRNPDGTGLGVFGADGKPVIRKQPIAAWEDSEFACEAHHLTGVTFIAHVRYASTGAVDLLNTHPFLQDGRIFAHNGVVTGLDTLDARLEELGYSDLLLGQTDSERVFALITASIRAHGGDIEAGVLDAIVWLADNVPIYSVNLLLSTATDVWALRYPEPNELYLLDRREVAPAQVFDLRTSRIHAQADQFDQHPCVAFASEPMNDDPGWKLLDSGMLVHVDEQLSISERMVFPDPPKHQLTLADLSPKASASQHTSVK